MTESKVQTFAEKQAFVQQSRKKINEYLQERPRLVGQMIKGQVLAQQCLDKNFSEAEIANLLTPMECREAGIAKPETANMSEGGVSSEAAAFDGLTLEQRSKAYSTVVAVSTAFNNNPYLTGCSVRDYAMRSLSEVGFSESDAEIIVSYFKIS